MKPHHLWGWGVALIIEATLLKEPAGGRKKGRCLRQSEEEIHRSHFPGRTAQKDQEASRPHPPPLVILPAAGIPSSSSDSRLNLCWNMAAGASLASRWRWRGGLGRRRPSLSGRAGCASAARFFPVFPPSFPSPVFAFWHHGGQPQTQFS